MPRVQLIISRFNRTVGAVQDSGHTGQDMMSSLKEITPV